MAAETGHDKLNYVVTQRLIKKQNMRLCTDKGHDKNKCVLTTFVTREHIIHRDTIQHTKIMKIRQCIKDR